MSPSKSFAQQQRNAEKLQKAENKAREQHAKDAEKKRKEYQHILEQQAKLKEKVSKENEKQRAILYTESRIALVDMQNADLESKIHDLETILKSTLDVDDYLDLDTLKAKPQLPHFVNPVFPNDNPMPNLEKYLPEKPSTLSRLIPGVTKKYEEDVAKANASYQQAVKRYETIEVERKKAIEHAHSKHINYLNELKSQFAQQHQSIEDFKTAVKQGVPEMLVNYFIMVLESSIYPDGFPQKAKIAYVPESKQLVVEYDLPNLDIVPEINLYKYTKTKDEITSTLRPLAQRKTLYASVIAQITIRTIHELFEADRFNHIESMVFNGYVETIDKGTGKDMRICLATVRTTRELFVSMNLKRVEPEACLKTLNASISKSPSELAPVRPVLEFNMVDPRFVQEADVLSSLDQRPNLMELTPGEFESLITNLFQKMGLEAKQTQASRDGGVDCVAYDPRPIFGGKVVIQAKRYKHTVGVSAVRDLYGTLQNEGASKGILVTTSGYGKAAFEFAEGKPIELLSGSNLIYLLEEHANIKAKIEAPQDWQDPQMDVDSVS